MSRDRLSLDLQLLTDQHEDGKMVPACNVEIFVFNITAKSSF